MGILRRVSELESVHHDAPDVAGVDAALWGCATDLSDPFHWLMERTTCIQREVSKQAASCDIGRLNNNAHILEEIGLLEKDMGHIRDGFDRLAMASRGRTDVEKFVREDIEQCMLRVHGIPYRFG